MSVVSILIAVIIFLIGGGFFLIKAAFKEMKELIDEIESAKAAEGPGGSSITNEEWKEIFKEAKEAFVSVQALIAKVLGMEWKKKRRFRDLVSQVKNK